MLTPSPSLKLTNSTLFSRHLEMSCAHYKMRRVTLEYSCSLKIRSILDYRASACAISILDENLTLLNFILYYQSITECQESIMQTRSYSLMMITIFCAKFTQFMWLCKDVMGLKTPAALYGCKSSFPELRVARRRSGVISIRLSALSKYPCRSRRQAPDPLWSGNP